jgi:hypothetical protein
MELSRRTCPVCGCVAASTTAWCALQLHLKRSNDDMVLSNTCLQLRNPSAIYFASQRGADTPAYAYTQSAASLFEVTDASYACCQICCHRVRNRQAKHSTIPAPGRCPSASHTTATGGPLSQGVLRHTRNSLDCAASWCGNGPCLLDADVSHALIFGTLQVLGTKVLPGVNDGKSCYQYANAYVATSPLALRSRPLARGAGAGRSMCMCSS